MHKGILLFPLQFFLSSNTPLFEQANTFTRRATEILIDTCADLSRHESKQTIIDNRELQITDAPDLLSDCIASLSAEKLTGFTHNSIPAKKPMAMLYKRVEQMARPETATQFMAIVKMKITFVDTMSRALKNTMNSNIHTLGDAYYAWAYNVLKLANEMNLPESHREQLKYLQKRQEDRALRRHIEKAEAAEDIEDIHLQSALYRQRTAAQGATEKGDAASAHDLASIRNEAGKTWWEDMQSWANIAMTGIGRTGFEIVAAPVKAIIGNIYLYMVVGGLSLGVLRRIR